MKSRRFVQVDVFASVPGRGNGLAVVVEAEGLSDADMQAFAAWTNLAETTFLLPPTDPRADYRVRIFTPGREMPFAGHPTLGSCAAWLHAGGVPASQERVVQECAIGLVDIDQTVAPPAFVAPPTKASAIPPERIEALCAALGIDPSLVLRAAALDNGPTWQVLELTSAQDVLAIESGRVRWPDYVGLAVIGPHAVGADCDFEVRNLTPSSGMSEDPITGSLNSAIAHWMWQEGRLTRDLVIAQGTCLGRLGRVFITAPRGLSDRILIGGHARIVIDGTVHL